MKKGLYLVLSLVVVFSLGAVFLHCGDDDPVDKCDPLECCEEDPECEAGTRCNFADGTCGDCCADAPAGEYHIWVSGMVLDMTTQQGIAAAVAAISPMDALKELDPEKLTDQVTGADGLFKTDCFDVTEVALGMVMMSDDVGWDGIAGTYFPSGSGAKGWDKNSEKYCAEAAKVFTVPNTIVAALDGYTNVDSAGFGFVIGFVVDSTFTPVADAVIKKGDGTDLVEVVYPAADFSAFDLTATSATGIYVLPHTNFAAGITEITAEKTGMTFAVEKAAPKAGFAYFVFIQAD